MATCAGQTEPSDRRQPMDVIVVVDMQVGLLRGPSKLDLAGVVDRINRLTDDVRARSGTVIFVRHCG
jgi:nicotinamidase-related amidase